VRQDLADRLLAKVMNWTPEDVSRERPLLENLAELKYDGYHNFFPGMRFVESLALWLDQFHTPEERKVAYRLIREKLIFFSDDEILHFVSMAFPDFIRPRLIAKLAKEQRVTPGFIVSGVETDEFRRLLRQTLFLGMSDGARVDFFRRFNRRISHEQVYPQLDLGPPKCEELLQKLATDILSGCRGEPASGQLRFRVLVLLDDFSASGTTCRNKLEKVFAGVTDSKRPLSALFDPADLEIIVLHYVSTETALGRVRVATQEWIHTHSKSFSCSIDAIQVLPLAARVDPSTMPGLASLLETYFDPSIVTEHYLKGKHDNPFLGFDECALPVVLGHNTPNDSLPLLWFDEDCAVRGVFPRVTRHRPHP
jgi:hypothetical protein